MDHRRGMAWHAAWIPGARSGRYSASTLSFNIEENSMHYRLKAQEDRIRRLARQNGYHVRKSREWKYVPHANNFGDYMLIDSDSNFIVLGSRYDATLDELEYYLKDGDVN
jgi:hypothetical protein